MFVYQSLFKRMCIIVTGITNVNRLKWIAMELQNRLLSSGSRVQWMHLHLLILNPDYLRLHPGVPKSMGQG